MRKESAGKKEKEKKKAKNKQDKEERKSERQANSNKGKPMEMMLAYVDENGNLSDTPPDMSRRKEINLEDIQLSAPINREVEEVIRKGVITFFNEAKGYGFINDLDSQQSVFVHINQLSEPVKERDKVTFEIEHGPRGLSAVNVKKTA